MPVVALFFLALVDQDQKSIMLHFASVIREPVIFFAENSTNHSWQGNNLTGLLS
jgi:hypothetical protein